MRSILLILTASAILACVTAGQAQQAELAKYCKADIQRLCQGVQPGAGRILNCLKAHKQEMTVGCAQALQKMQATRK